MEACPIQDMMNSDKSSIIRSDILTRWMGNRSVHKNLLVNINLQVT